MVLTESGRFSSSIWTKNGQTNCCMVFSGWRFLGNSVVGVKSWHGRVQWLRF